MWNRVLKNTFWLTTGEIVGRLLRIVLVLYAARVLGAADWGVFSYSLSLAAMFTVLADIGIGAVLTRELVRDQENGGRYLSSSFFIKTIFLSITVVVIIFITPFFSNIKLTESLLVFMASLVVADNIRIFSGSINRAAEKMHLEAFTNIFTQTIIVALGVWVLHKKPSAEGLGISYAVGSGLGAIVGILTIREHWKKIFSKFDGQVVKTLFKAAWPFALLGLLGSIMLNTDIVMLGWLRTATEIGYYSSAQKIIFTLYILPTLIGAAAFPSWTRLANKDKVAFADLLEKTLKIVFMIALPVMIGGLIVGTDIIRIFFGQEYLPAASTFKVLLLSLVVNFPSAILGNALFAYDQQRYFILYGGAGALGNVILNFALIPSLGIVGAAIATVVTQVLSTFLSWRKMLQVNHFSIWSKLWKITLASMAMGGVVLLMNVWQYSIFVSIPTAIVVYLGSLYLLKEPIISELKNIIHARSSH